MADQTSPADRADAEDEPADARAGDVASEPSDDDGERGARPAGVTGAGRKRLGFAAAYPEHPELDALLDAFEAGNYAWVREQAPALAKRSEDPAISRAARDLVSRLSPDPLAVRMLIGAGLLLLFLIYWFYSDHH